MQEQPQLSLEAEKAAAAVDTNLNYGRVSIPLPHQKIIGLSANSDYDTTEAAYKAGIDIFMPKPFRVETFLGLLVRLGLGNIAL